MEKHAALKEKMEGARREVVEEHGAPGMVIDEIVPDEDQDGRDVDANEIRPKKMPHRKTQAQKKKKALLLAEVSIKFSQVV